MTDVKIDSEAKGDHMREPKKVKIKKRVSDSLLQVKSNANKRESQKDLVRRASKRIKEAEELLNILDTTVEQQQRRKSRKLNDFEQVY